MKARGKSVRTLRRRKQRRRAQAHSIVCASLRIKLRSTAETEPITCGLCGLLKVVFPVQGAVRGVAYKNFEQCMR
eukprot:6214557-Pleurochrysis_carterae.AAC.8